MEYTTHTNEIAIGLDVSLAHAYRLARLADSPAIDVGQGTGERKQWRWPPIEEVRRWLKARTHKTDPAEMERQLKELGVDTTMDPFNDLNRGAK